MKKFKHITLALVLVTTLHTISIIAKAQNELGNNPLASNIDYTVYTKKMKLKRNGAIEFTPNESFGGVIAQGHYNDKNKTAIITNNSIKYSFKNIKENLNPEKPKTKNDENLIILGSFINGITRGMPIIMYLFGEEINQNEIN